MTLDVALIIEYAIMFATAIFFTGLAVSRETILSYILASVVWFATGIANFYLDPSGVLSISLAWIFGVVGSLFMAMTLHAVYVAHIEKKEERFKPL